MPGNEAAGRDGYTDPKMAYREKLSIRCREKGKQLVLFFKKKFLTVSSITSHKQNDISLTPLGKCQFVRELYGKGGVELLPLVGCGPEAVHRLQEPRPARATHEAHRIVDRYRTELHAGVPGGTLTISEPPTHGQREKQNSCAEKCKSPGGKKQQVPFV